jgi:GNAT superfamily N-acetyltransferase
MLLEAAPADAGRLRAALAATWPPAEIRRAGAFTLRRGAGGGSRVSAATLDGTDADADPGEAEALMRAWGQAPLFRIGPGEEAFDARLAARGYAVRDPTLVLAAPAAEIARPPGEAAIFGAGALACMAEIWAAGGIGPARLAVMARAPEPRAFILGRLGDRPAGAAFVALHAGVAVVHAVEVAAFARHQGLGAAVTAAAAGWGLAQGAATFALAVTRANAPARALYARLGMRESDGYHYRVAGSATA